MTANVELSYSGYEFLTTIFEKYDLDKDKALSPQVKVLKGVRWLNDTSHFKCLFRSWSICLALALLCHGVQTCTIQFQSATKDG